MGVVLSMRDVGKMYVAGYGGCRAAVRALGGVSLRIDAGEIVELAGPRGAGKTTLLLCAAGLLRPDRGSVAWPAAPLAAASPIRAGYAMYVALRDGQSSLGDSFARYADSGARLVLVDLGDVTRAGSALAIDALDAIRGRGAAIVISSRAPCLAAATRLVLLERGRLVRDSSIERDASVAARVAEPL